MIGLLLLPGDRDLFGARCVFQSITSANHDSTALDSQTAFSRLVNNGYPSKEIFFFFSNKISLDIHMSLDHA